ncbi:hypothetical protein D9619_011552 [Psilocybe cf. subviscida]|uniref:Uncharacterized protein n=1 Tax=Psilocybe cf. subviscida TaxID=2480587 RepID=A0A8H5BS84_9AGAR|nr:hypothetical protein D9619_011552 [Psilocybe cf. subviscida]
MASQYDLDEVKDFAEKDETTFTYDLPPKPNRDAMGLTQMLHPEGIAPSA